MPVTFGSVGDIIAVGLLVKDLIAALDEARGSKAEYWAAVQAIKTLDDTINLVNQHVIRQGVATSELRNLCETSRQAVARCSALGDAFLKRIRRYQTTFEESHRPNKLKEITMGVRWRIGEKEALERFHAEVLGASLSLQTLLATANFTLLGVNRKEINNKLDEAKLIHDTTIISHETALNSIKDGINDANSNIEACNSILVKVSEALKFDWIRKLGSELKGVMRGVMAVNFATYRAVIRLESALPSHLERRLIEDPMILEDPIGRIAPVHLQFITSWDAFNAVLEARFHDRQGYSKIKQRKYGLQLSNTGKEIEQSRPWHCAFSPGQRIEMSFIFSRDNEVACERSKTTCPGCHTPSDYSNDADTQCKNCQMWFRRITLFHDDEPQLQAHMQRSILQPNATNTIKRKRNLSNTSEDEEEDVANFKRVRLVSNIKRASKHEEYATAVWQTRKVLMRLSGFDYQMNEEKPRKKIVKLFARAYHGSQRRCVKLPMVLR